MVGRAYDTRLVRRLWALARPHRRLVWLSLALYPMTASVELLQPWLLKVAIDEYVLPGDWVGLGHMALAFLASLLVLYGLRAVQTYVLHLTGQRVMHDLQGHALRPPAATRRRVLRPEPGRPPDDPRAERRGGHQRDVRERRGGGGRRRGAAARRGRHHARHGLAARPRHLRGGAPAGRRRRLLPAAGPRELPAGPDAPRSPQRVPAGVAPGDDGHPALRPRARGGEPLRRAQRRAARGPVPIDLLRRVPVRGGGGHRVGRPSPCSSGTAAGRSWPAPSPSADWSRSSSTPDASSSPSATSARSTR